MISRAFYYDDIIEETEGDPLSVKFYLSHQRIQVFLIPVIVVRHGVFGIHVSK